MKTPKGTHPEAVALRKLAQMDARQLQEEAARLANIDGLSRGQRAHYRRIMQTARARQIPIALMSEPERRALQGNLADKVELMDLPPDVDECSWIGIERSSGDEYDLGKYVR